MLYMLQMFIFLHIPVILDVLVYSLHLTLVYIFSLIVFLGYIQSSGKKMKRRFIREKDIPEKLTRLHWNSHQVNSGTNIMQNMIQ